MSKSGLTLAYHGCDAVVRDDLVTGRLPSLTPSKNSYDWLGNGIYFFEGDHQRARMFAQAAHAQPNKRYTRQAIASPAVVGAVLNIHRWLDMTTQEGRDEFRVGLDVLSAAAMDLGADMPRNAPADSSDTELILRHLDRGVFNMIHQLRKRDPTAPPIQAVRGAFYQGAPLAPSSEFREHTHIQIALTDPSCVVAWFLPPGVRLMTEGEHEAARAALDVAKQKYSSSKQRLRVAV